MCMCDAYPERQDEIMVRWETSPWTTIDGADMANEARRAVVLKVMKVDFMVRGVEV